MDILNDDALMIARGKVSTLRRELHQQRKTAAELAAIMSRQSLLANTALNDGAPTTAIAALDAILSNCAALHSLCDSIAALQAQMKPLQAIAWPTERVDE